MQAIILAGGLGTRARELTRNKIPKPMLHVNGRPLLEYILDWLLTQNTEKIIFAIGFKGEVITQHFKDNYKGIEIQYSYEEDNLLGTGGAIKRPFAAGKEINFLLKGTSLREILKISKFLGRSTMMPFTISALRLTTNTSLRL